MDSSLIPEILNRLEGEYGKPAWQPRAPLAVLVETILSQNTSDANSHRAFLSLRERFSRWEEVAEADEAEIARCIGQGGLGNIKARRIKEVLREINRQQGALELGFLKSLNVQEGLAWLETLPGVGEKTSRCTLLFAFGMPALPVDTHIWRVSERLGLIAPGTSIKEAHRALAEMVAPANVYRFHVLLITQGRKVCRAGKPNCQECAVKGLCSSCNETHTYQGVKRQNYAPPADT